jgi:hypothetical protein
MNLILFHLFATLSLVVAYEVIYAVNCGGPKLKLVNEMQFEHDYNTQGRVGTLNNVTIGGVSQREGYLYQSQRFGSSLLYEIPVTGKGAYLLLLKFANIWEGTPTATPRQLDVKLNGDITVMSKVNVYEEAGMYQAYDRFIHFSVKDGNVIYKEQPSVFTNGKLSLEFEEQNGHAWVSAILLLKGYDVDNYFTQ